MPKTIVPRVFYLAPRLPLRPRVFHHTQCFPVPGTPYLFTPIPRFPPSLKKSITVVCHYFCLPLNSCACWRWTSEWTSVMGSCWKFITENTTRSSVKESNPLCTLVPSFPLLVQQHLFNFLSVCGSLKWPSSDLNDHFKGSRTHELQRVGLRSLPPTVACVTSGQYEGVGDIFRQTYREQLPIFEFHRIHLEICCFAGEVIIQLKVGSRLLLKGIPARFRFGFC